LDGDGVGVQMVVPAASVAPMRFLRRRTGKVAGARRGRAECFGFAARAGMPWIQVLCGAGARIRAARARPHGVVCGCVSHWWWRIWRWPLLRCEGRMRAVVALRRPVLSRAANRRGANAFAECSVDGLHAVAWRGPVCWQCWRFKIVDPEFAI
jgi:hypothetical protein